MCQIGGSCVRGVTTLSGSCFSAAGKLKIVISFFKCCTLGVVKRGPTAVSSLGMSNWTLVLQTIDCLLVFPQCLHCSHSIGLCSSTELEDSSAKTMSADSFSERAKLLSRVAVTTHTLCMCTIGWT